MNIFEANKISKKTPPLKSTGLFSDSKYFVFQKPKFPTLVKFKSKSERLEYNQRIMQRLGIDVNEYRILNIHKIGVDAPAKYIFEELLRWNGDSSCWPNYIAHVDRIDNQLENIRILLFGISKYPFGFKKSFFGIKYVPLFNLTSIRFQHIPEIGSDNARFLLFKCSGGYPVGVFSMYVRSSIDEQNEKEQSQLFLLVGFNFYGNRNWTRFNIINHMWEIIHNRLTANILNRLKQLNEWKFEKIKGEPF